MYCSIEVYCKKRRPGLSIMAFLSISLLISNVFFISLILSGFNISDIKLMMPDSKLNQKNGNLENNYIFNNKNTEMVKLLNNTKEPSFMNIPLKNIKSEDVNNQNKSLDARPEKVAYLTFDDGPSYSITPKILKILDEQNIKATFFVLGEMCKLNPGILKQQQEKGHLICNHTYSHDYKKIYSGTEAFIEELKQCEDTIVSILGTDWDSNKFVRFPGGSFEKKFDPYKEELKKLGYAWFDWNALSGDAEGVNVPVEKLKKNIAGSTENINKALILMHDSGGKETTVKALPDIIKYLKEKGYVFETLKTYRND